MNRTLFEHGEDAIALMQLLDEVEGDLSDPQVEAAINGWLEETQSGIENKVDAYVGIINECEAMANVREAEAARIAALAEVDKNKAKRLRNTLAAFFDLHDIKKLSTPRFNVTLAGNGGRTPVELDEVDPDTLPMAFKRVIVEPDKNAIREYLEAGNELSFARIGARGKSLRIR